MFFLQHRLGKHTDMQQFWQHGSAKHIMRVVAHVVRYSLCITAPRVMHMEKGRHHLILPRFRDTAYVYHNSCCTG